MDNLSDDVVFYPIGTLNNIFVFFFERRVLGEHAKVHIPLEVEGT
jgi:hypothetical protein